MTTPTDLDQQPPRASAAELDALHERRCARKAACPHRSTVTASDGTEHRVGRRLETPTGLCDACLTSISAAIRDLPGDYLRLYAELAPGRGAGSPKVAGSREAPIPLAVGRRDLAVRIVHLAITWAEPLAETMGIDLEHKAVAHTLTDGTFRLRVRRPDRLLGITVRVLASNVPRLLALPEMLVETWSPDGRSRVRCLQSGLDGALELAHLHHLTDLHLGLDELQHKLPAPCPRCEHMTLVRDNGSAVVRCTRGCVTWPESDYQRLTLVLADDLAEAS